MTTPAGPAVGRSVVVAGFGSEYRRDDGAGILVAEDLAARLGVRDVGPVVDPLDLLGRWDDADLAVVVDALRSGADPGTLRTIELTVPASPAGSGPAEGDRGRPGAGDGHGPEDLLRGSAVTSTHGIGLAGVFRLARAVGHAPARVVVVGIEGSDFGQGTGLSPAVAAAVPRAVETVLRIIEEARACA
ncbi:MAG TPA: hydrogenase maturation protease [Acidimicrobiales bacterium]